MRTIFGLTGGTYGKAKTAEDVVDLDTQIDKFIQSQRRLQRAQENQ